MPEAVFNAPECGSLEIRVLALIEEARQQLRFRVAEPKRWSGSLRRMAFARAVQGSNSIEGYNASLDDVLAAVDDEPTLDADDETRLALAGYRDAMTYVLQIAQDQTAQMVDEGLLKALHFMMIKHDLSKSPGRWRPGDIRDSWADVSAARDVLGYMPSVDLEQGLRRTIEHLGF